MSSTMETNSGSVCRQEGFDLVFIFDMGLGVGMENQLEAVILTGNPGNAMGGVHQPGEGRVIQPGGRDLLTGEQVGVAILDENQEFGVELVEHLSPAAQLLFNPRPGRFGV